MKALAQQDLESFSALSVFFLEHSVYAVVSPSWNQDENKDSSSLSPNLVLYDIAIAIAIAKGSCQC